VHAGFSKRACREGRRMLSGNAKHAGAFPNRNALSLYRNAAGGDWEGAQTKPQAL
jgi:hypothetical protein